MAEIPLGRQLDRALQDNSKDCEKCKHLAASIGWAHSDLRHVLKQASYPRSLPETWRPKIKEARQMLTDYRSRGLEHLQAEHT